jgi:putative membrane protein
MRLLSDGLVLLVALEHAWFLVLEMFLWTTPLGLRTFRQSAEKANASRALAANQGLYLEFAYS